MNHTIRLYPIGLDEQGRSRLTMAQHADIHAAATAITALQSTLSSPFVRTRLRFSKDGTFLVFSGLVPNENLHAQLTSIGRLTGAIEAHALDPSSTKANELREAESAFDPAALKSLCNALDSVVRAQSRQLQAHIGDSSVEVRLPHRTQLSLYTQRGRNAPLKSQDAPVVQQVDAVTEVLCEDGLGVLVVGGEGLQPAQHVVINMRPAQPFGWGEHWDTNTGANGE
ncbi:hypothetical protein [Lysobacter sp. A289]